MIRHLFGTMMITILAFSYLPETAAAGGIFSRDDHVAIHSTIQGAAIKVHCMSDNEEDVGMRSLGPNQWSGFKVKKGWFVIYTQYFCLFYWGNRYYVVDVYNDEFAKMYRSPWECEGHYDWEVREDGFWSRCGHCPSTENYNCEWRHDHSWTRSLLRTSWGVRASRRLG